VSAKKNTAIQGTSGNLASNDEGRYQTVDYQERKTLEIGKLLIAKKKKGKPVGKKDPPGKTPLGQRSSNGPPRKNAKRVISKRAMKMTCIKKETRHQNRGFAENSPKSLAGQRRKKKKVGRAPLGKGDITEKKTNPASKKNLKETTNEEN